MIIDSDNAATYTLIDHIRPEALTSVFNELGLESPDLVKGTYTISAKDYSLFFRVLYNATYLGRKNSERALGLLAQASFKDALVAGIPTETVVAHKYGTRSTLINGTIVNPELHDCGIVYKPEHPYFLCVMTRGSTMPGLKKTIGDISALVYKELGD